MKRMLIYGSAVTAMMALLLAAGCGGEIIGEAGVESLYQYIPEDAAGIFVLNFKKLTTLSLYDDMVKDLEKDEDSMDGGLFKNYQEFVAKTGIDPKTDLYAMAAGIFGDLAGRSDAGKEPDVVMVMKLDYDKDKILALMKEEGVDLTAELKGTVTVYPIRSAGDPEEDDRMNMIFIDARHGVLVSDGMVDPVVALIEGKGSSILKNQEMKQYLDTLGGDKIGWMVFDFPEQLKQPSQEGSPFKMDLSKAETFYGMVDYVNNAWNGEFTLVSPAEEANKQMVSMLNGLKGMAAMAGPEVSELVGNINLSSDAEKIQMTFSISDELLKRLREKAKEKAEELTGGDTMSEEATEY